MSRVSRSCDITGKKRQVGNKVSHANNKTKTRKYPNLRKKRFFDSETQQFITLRVSQQGLRTIDKKGGSIIESLLAYL
jgi:large subunit ribosomal protein L28